MLDQLLERSDALPLGNRAVLARISALCDDRSATAEGVALESARDEDFAAVAPATSLAAVVHVAGRLVRKAGIGVEPVVDPTRDAIELACVFDLTAAAARLQSLLEAQERFDSHVDAGR